MLLLAMAFVLFFSFSQNKLRKEQLKAQQTKLEYQEKLLHSTLQTQEEERSRIAKDLHDEVGSKLNVMNLFLHQLSKKAPEASGSIAEMKEVLNDTLQTSRRISHDLLPPTLEKFGLTVAIEEVAERLSQSDQLQVEFESSGQRPQPPNNMLEIHLFRVLQELINNTLKYAGASRIYIQLTQSEAETRLLYQDDGVGFDPHSMSSQKGLGMKNIESRLQMIGGHYQLHTAPGQGVKVEVVV